MNTFSNDYNIPVGLSVGLSTIEDSTTHHKSITNERKQQIISQTHTTKSQKNMERYVEELARNGAFE